MTLLSIATDVADETKGPRPVTIISNTDPDAQNMLRLINKVGTKLMKIYPWNILRKEHTFTAPGVETLIASASMPSDFDRFVPETFWDRDSNNLLSGPVSAVEWAGLKVQTFSSQNKKFLYRGGDILTQPVLASGVSLAFEYMSDKWCDISAGGTPKVKFTLDNDVALLDEELITQVTIYEWLKAEGQPYGDAAQDARGYLDMLTDHDDATANIAVVADIFALNSRHSTGEPKASRASYGGDF
jgi:hypothetical protein